jgi:hypothetical protein
MQVETPRFHAWLAAEKEAHEAERRLHAEMLRFARSASPEPLSDVVLVARAKRLKAHALFGDAMQELKELARSLHHRQILTTGPTLPEPANTQHQPGSEAPPPSIQDSR